MSEHIPTGVHEMTMPAYVKAPGVSKSMLDHLAYPKTPAHLKAYLEEPSEPPTPAQEFGTALHAALLQPDTMSNFAVRPAGLDLRTKVGKEWALANEDRPQLTIDSKKTIERCVENVWKHPIAKRLMTGSTFERSIFAEDNNGTQRKGRLDILTNAGNVLPDVKTCASAAGEDFEKSVLDYRYHVQAAYYLDLCKLIGIDREHFVFICVEKTPPYAVAVHQLDDLVVEWGRKLYQRDLTVYRRCIETGEWPGYPHDVGIIGVPRWAMKEMENTV